MESSFALLQKNVLDRQHWTSRNDLRPAIVSWIETSYHRRRGNAVRAAHTHRVRDGSTRRTRGLNRDTPQPTEPGAVPIPAWLIIFVAWVGAGFLVPVFFSTVISATFSLGGPTNGAATESPSSDAMPVWESAFLSIGFAGMAVGR